MTTQLPTQEPQTARDVIAGVRFTLLGKLPRPLEATLTHRTADRILATLATAGYTVAPTTQPDATTPTPADREALAREMLDLVLKQSGRTVLSDKEWRILSEGYRGTPSFYPQMQTAYAQADAALAHERRTHAADVAAAERRGQEEVRNLDPCLQKQRPGEPMFILLGRDSAAAFAIEEWCNRRLLEIETGSRADTPQERQHVAEVFTKATSFRSWRAAPLTTPTDTQPQESADAD